ncbi:MAG: hypothetical protein AUJ92_18200 [Armatimonadetes bacterium CG2_30_59_28]|nr:hypothetical protein [Armatimonadota bacterium]OIO90656.1 MAG: hypothetical protein AUJ92_18200 [Armatimonadetes bacterium CG2_30_59_28]PIU62871.1 MAG: hypothetical protein COS85_17330 [Armatimonadetes bacterium CG07_land_8_20_14_0_80_59_28]PJB70790.1 MAG: hypothetical protein CO095_08660 [Armatimonadetes bacterium CG_4_9_14_3_um_filter_58_7]
MRYRTTARFERNLRDLEPRVREQFYDQLDVLLDNPRHPSLHTKRVQRQRGVLEGRVDIHHRFTFHYDRGVLVLRAIGSHDEVLRNP